MLYPAYQTACLPKFTAMSINRQRRFIINLLLGLIFTSTGICSILYACFTIQEEKDWIIWAIISVITLNAGLLFLGSSVINKVKADLIRRQRQRSRTGHHSPVNG